MKQNKAITKAVICVLSFSMLLGCQAKPEEVVTKFYRSLEAGEISKAKECFSNEVASKLGDQKLTMGLTEESKKIQKCGGIKSLNVTLEGQGEIRSGNVALTFKGDCPEKNEEKINLVQENGTWKISINK